MSYWENTGQTDDWYTPKYIFDALNVLFDMDVAAPIDRSFCHVPSQVFLTEDSLSSVWDGFVWMNPPFGGRNGIIPWLNKIYEHGNGIALTPDRISAPWWQNASKQCGVHMQINGKVKFIKPDGTIGKAPGTGTTLFAYGEKGIAALLKAQENGLGTVFKKL